MQFGLVDPAERVDRLHAEQEVLRDVEVGNRHQLLVDHRDALGQRGVGRREAHRLAAPLDGAAVRLIEPGQHLHQCRLAGAIFAHQRVHLAGVEIDGGLLQNGQTTEGLGQLAGAEHGALLR